jgi:hypothetical protein
MKNKLSINGFLILAFGFMYLSWQFGRSYAVPKCVGER